MELVIRKKRNVMRVGNSRGVTIPPAWIEMHDIEIGDRVNMKITDEGELLIQVEQYARTQTT